MFCSSNLKGTPSAIKCSNSEHNVHLLQLGGCHGRAYTRYICWTTMAVYKVFHFSPHHLEGEFQLSRTCRGGWQPPQTLELRRKLLSYSQSQKFGQFSHLASDWLFALVHPIRSQLACWPNSWPWLQLISFHPWPGPGSCAPSCLSAPRRPARSTTARTPTRGPL